MLVKVELDEKQRGELSPLKKMNGTLPKYTEPDGTKKYLAAGHVLLGAAA